jgi:hypothetical protein
MVDGPPEGGPYEDPKADTTKTRRRTLRQKRVEVEVVLAEFAAVIPR